MDTEFCYLLFHHLSISVFPSPSAYHSASPLLHLFSFWSPGNGVHTAENGFGLHFGVQGILWGLALLGLRKMTERLVYGINFVDTK